MFPFGSTLAITKYVVGRERWSTLADGVAARARTSCAVLYRRWSGKPELVHAALIEVINKNPITVPRP